MLFLDYYHSYSVIFVELAWLWKEDKKKLKTFIILHEASQRSQETSWLRVKLSIWTSRDVMMVLIFFRLQWFLQYFQKMLLSSNTRWNCIDKPSQHTGWSICVVSLHTDFFSLQIYKIRQLLLNSEKVNVLT